MLRTVILVCIGMAAAVTTSSFARTVTAADGSTDTTAPQRTDAAIDYDTLLTQMAHLTPDKGMVAPVSGMLLQRDVAAFVLASGTLYACKPVAGRRMAVLFVGKGTVSYTPPTDVERKQLARFLDDDHLMRPFTKLFMVFSDDTWNELSTTVKFTAGTVAEDIGPELESDMQYLNDPDDRYIDEGVANTMLNDLHDNGFYAEIMTDGEKPLVFRIDPYENEEVQLLRQARTDGGTKYMELINQFHIESAYDSGVAARGYRDIDVSRESIKFDIASNLDVTASARLTVVPLHSAERWIYLHLYSGLHVDSVVWSDGESASAFNTSGSTFWIRNQPMLDSGQSATVDVYYHGTVIDRKVDWVELESSVMWYPSEDYRNKAEFDLTFSYPSNFTLASVGSLQSTETDGDAERTTSHWVTTAPIRNASFNIGLFKTYEFTNDSIPPVTELMSNSQRTTGADMEEQVGGDVASSIKLFTFLFGSCPVDHFYATEIPGGHGEAFPGLIHLSWSTFQNTDESGSDEIFRAHEVAHQWWGIGVDFDSYHDQWLSEGFAEYSALLYVQAVRKDNDTFFEWLDRYREAIVDNRRSFLVKAPDAGPIWLGYRTNSSRTPDDYDIIIYKKGAWVLHMLRNLMMDINSLDDSKFRAMMRDFFETYEGRRATTADIQHVVERHVGTDMSWFFKEWVYGTDVPTYTCSYKVDEQADGTYLLTCRVDQSEVPDDFRMYLPIRIDFGNDRVGRGRMLVSGPTSTMQLKLPSEPEDVTFNDLSSVLCELDETGWQD